MSLLDDVFELLQVATRLEETKGNRIEAATKYYEAVYLMRQYLQHSPQTPQQSQTRLLLDEKIQHYSAVAAQLLADDSSTTQSIVSDPRSPMANHCFFNEDPSVLTVPLPPASPRLTQPAVLNKKAGLANTKLALAIDLDEKGDTKAAIDTYMAAAEIYLQTIRISEEQPGSSSITPVLTRRLEGALDRVGQLKQPNSQSRHVVEQQKAREQNRQEQNSTSSYTQAEIAVLKRSSLIASGIFLPWSEEEAQELSLRAQMAQQSQSRSVWRDPEGDLLLNDKQKKRFWKWARPNEIAQHRRIGNHQAPIMIRSINPYSIRQQYVTDCSFIASLCICADFERRFRKRLVTSIIYPQDRDGIPIYSPEGKYMVKLWLNGVARQVIVDDRLPIDRNSNLLCSDTTGSRTQLELWVPIIEKAYMKLCGGYDFPGSNSGVDMFSLTGWIPERIFFAKDEQKVRDFETAPERAWERLFSANSFGDCLITVSTSKDITEEQAEALGLVTGHAYAVLDVIQTKDGTRLLQLKNPWASKAWRGRYSCHDLSSWRDPAFRAEVGYDPELAAKHDDGIFWISWDDVILYFQNLQLSWNPALFAYRVVTHSAWPKERGPNDDTFNVGDNPQYVLSLSKDAVDKKASIWVLISRHVTKQEQEGIEVTDFLTIHLLKTSSQKERIWYPHGSHSLINGAYTNNPHVLVRYDATGPADEFISLVLSQYKKSNDMNYTLSCFCTEPFSLGNPEKDLPETSELSGSWTPTSAGGPVGKDGFFTNPMYVVTIPLDATIQIRCSTVKTYSVNVMLVVLKKTKSKSGDYRQLTKMRGKPILDSGNYRHGFVVTERKQIPAGEYTLIISSFHPGQVGAFHVNICSSVKVKIDEVP